MGTKIVILMGKSDISTIKSRFSVPILNTFAKRANETAKSAVLPKIVLSKRNPDVAPSQNRLPKPIFFLQNEKTSKQVRRGPYHDNNLYASNAELTHK